MSLPPPQIIYPPKIPKHLPVANLEVLTKHGEYSGIGLTGCDFNSQVTEDVLFEQVQFRRVIFMQTHLTRLRMADVRAEVCDFSGSVWEVPRLRRVEFIGCRMLGMLWSEAQLDDVLFKDCILEGAVLVKAVCKGVRFEKCTLRGASLEESDLSGVVFAVCNLSDANLRATTLHETDLRSSILNGVHANPQDLRGAIIEPAQAIQLVGLLGVTVRDFEPL